MDTIKFVKIDFYKTKDLSTILTFIIKVLKIAFRSYNCINVNIVIKSHFGVIFLGSVESDGVLNFSIKK